MSYNIYCAKDELTSPKIAQAFYEAIGGNVYTDNIERDGTWIGFGSPFHLNTLEYTRKTGQDFYYVDHAYFGRGMYYRVTKNRLFHYGEGQSDMTRIKRFFSAAHEWKHGNKIIICPQSKGFFARNGIDELKWIQDVVQEVRKITNMRIIIHRKKDRIPLKKLLSDAYCIISHSSNCAVEALMHGVPAINLADSPSKNMTRNSISDLRNLLYPENRLEWAGVLADNQFTLEEIRNGYCWKVLNDKV